MIDRRPATPEDETFLRRLFESVRAHEFAGIPLADEQKSMLIDMQFRAQRAHYHQEYPEASFEILIWEGQPVGNLTTEVTETGLKLIDVNVLPAYQGRGFGTALLSEVIEQSKGRPITLHVITTNRARALYSRMGFQEEEILEPYVRMVRPSTP